MSLKRWRHIINVWNLFEYKFNNEYISYQRPIINTSYLFFPYSDSDENELDMILAEAREEVDDSDEYIDTDEDEYDSYDSDEALDDVPSLEGGFSNFSDEETKSKFTQYSMSSSVIRRNEQLSTLDDQFEKFFVDQYDENDMGSLGTI